MGIICVLGANQTRWPTFILVVGIVLIVAGVLLPFIGMERIERFANFWLQLPDGVIRVWAVMAMAFGAVLVWAAV